MDEDDEVCPIDIIFGESGIPTDCTKYNHAIMCSILDHHADLIPIVKGYEILKKCPAYMIHGNGLTTAKHIMYPAIQLQKEHKRNVKSGIFAQLLTHEHPDYPLITFYGFILVATNGMKFANIVQNQVDDHFSNADMVVTTSGLIAVITQSSPFPHTMITQIKNSTKWGNPSVL